jgi:four helix bundle protein
MKKELIENNPILKNTIQFSLMVIEYCDILDGTRKYTVSNQLLRSATSIGANCMESQNAESKADFIHKMKIAAKEADEVQYWLTLCEFANNYPDCLQLQNKLIEIQKILNSILATAKRKSPISFLLSYIIF